MTIPALDLQGTTTSTPVLLEFTTASLEPVLHRASLGKQVQSVPDSVSSLCVCQATLQTQHTECDDGIESPLEGLYSTLGLNPSRAFESPPSNHYLSPLINSPPLPSKSTLEPLPISLHLSMVSQPHFSFINLTTAPPPNVTVSRFGSPSSTFAYTIRPSHGLPLIPNSTNSTDALSHLSGCNDFDQGVPRMGFSFTHSEANLHLMRLRQLSCDVFFTDSSGWFGNSLVGPLEKGILHAAELFDDMSKRWSDGSMGTLFAFIYHPASDLDALAIDLYADFSLWFTCNLDFRHVWDPGDAVTNTIELMPYFKCHENHFGVHLQFLVLQLDLINLAMHPTCLQPPMPATGIGIIQHKSWRLHLTVHSPYMRYCSCSTLSTDYVVCMTEMHRFLPALEMCLYENESYHISIVGVYPFAATNVILSLQRLVGLVLITDPMVILPAFGKHFNVESDYKTLDSFNAHGLLLLHYLIEIASTDFGLTASTMISIVYLEGLLGHAQGSIGLQLWGNDGSHGLAGKIQILGIASMIAEPEMLFMEPIKQAQPSTNFSAPQLLDGGSFSAQCTSQFVSYLLGYSKSPHDLFESYCQTNHPNWMWSAIVLIFDSYDNNDQRYDSPWQKETKALSQTLIHGILASLTIPLYGLIVGSYRHNVDLQYLIGCITFLETWWQGQSLNSKLIQHTSEFPTAKYLGRVEGFNGFVTSYFPYYFWTSNLITEHVNGMTDALLQYWNDMHAVLVCVAFALLSMYKLEHIFVSMILSFATTDVTCMSYWFNPKVSFADNRVWNRNVFISLIVWMGVLLGNIVPIELLVPHLLYIRSLGDPKFVEADKLKSGDQIPFHHSIYYMTSRISITFLEASNFIVWKTPMDLAVLSNESHSVSCQSFYGFGPLHSLPFTLLNDSPQLEHNMTVQTWGTNHISLSTDYISNLSWLMAATRRFLIWHPGVWFFLYSTSTNGLPFSPRIQGPLILWVYYLTKKKMAILHACWTCGLFGDSQCTSFGSIYHGNFFFLAPHGLGEQAAPTSACQLDGMRTCLILRGREC